MRITKRNISRICRKTLLEVAQNSVSIDNAISKPSDINGQIKKAQATTSDGTNVTFQASRADNNTTNDRTIVYNSKHNDNIAQSVQKDLTDHKINANDTIVVTDGNNDNVYESKLVRKWHKLLKECGELPFDVECNNEDDYDLVPCGHGYKKVPRKDLYADCTDEEMKEIADDMEADYWVDYYKSNPYED